MTMPRVAALPMYDIDRAAVQVWWEGIASRLRAGGLDDVPHMLDWPDDLHAHWHDPRLLLSQACGLPLVTRLAGRVQVVGAFRYDAPGCVGIEYRSELVVRAEDAGRRFEDFRGRIAAINDPGSHSGCNALYALAAPLARDGRFFESAVVSGSHRASLSLLQRRLADIAAIDCVTLAGLRRHAPERLEGLRVIGHTALVPGLPLVTAAGTSPMELALLRHALDEACRDPVLADARAALFIAGFEATPADAWQPVEQMRHTVAAAFASPGPAR
jgi:ABC-type phosphate/phosphonate transport system substrate-binding protein